MRVGFYGQKLRGFMRTPQSQWFMKVISNLLHCNGVCWTGLSISTIFAVFKRVKVCLHKLLISHFMFLRYKTITPPLFPLKETAVSLSGNRGGVIVLYLRNIKWLMSNLCKQTLTLLNTAKIVEIERPVQHTPLQWSRFEITFINHWLCGVLMNPLNFWP